MLPPGRAEPVTGHADHTPDAEVEGRLIARVLVGDEQAFRMLYRAHSPRLYRFALRLTGGREAEAEDLLQETWRRGVPGLRVFERRSSLATWLSAILARCASEGRRNGARTPLAVARFEDIEELHGTGPVHDDRPGDTMRSATRIDLERAFALLPDGFRTVLVLHDVEGHTHARIGEILDISEGTSKSQLSRARARMRELLGEDYAAR